jgi:ethanolaminephosphotransferase
MKATQSLCHNQSPMSPRKPSSGSPAASVSASDIHMFNQREQYNIRTYSYHGGDRSLLYQHVLSPLAQFCVDHFTPVWVAPNVITLLGLVGVIAVTALGLALDPSMTGPCPSWFSYLLASSIFVYQTLDNMDGKQARKTGSSSALGMLFDHSCDAINTVVLSLASAKVMGIGWSKKILLFHMYAYCPFFFQTWLEYFSGSMWLPPFNGPSEGLIMIMITCILSGYNGSHWWHEVS